MSCPPILVGLYKSAYPPVTTVEKLYHKLLCKVDTPLTPDDPSNLVMMAPTMNMLTAHCIERFIVLTSKMS